MLKLGVGRPAVREALQALDLMGLIVVSHGERARVVVPSADSLTNHMTGAIVHFLSISSNGLKDLKHARILFEVAMCRLATANATRADLDRLRELLRGMEQTIGHGQAFQDADMAFHRGVAAMSGNQLFAALSEAMLGWLSRFRVALVNSEGVEALTLEEHERIYRAIAAGNAEAAAKAMHEHLTRANSFYEKT